MMKNKKVLGIIGGKDAAESNAKCSFRTAKLPGLKLTGMLILILIIGFTVFGCDDGNTTPAHSHTAGDAATCTTPQTCTTCGAVLQAAIGHDYGDDSVWVQNAEDATCTDPSYDIRNCGNAPCIEKDRRTGSNPALGHDLPGAYPATCMATGSAGTGDCDRCYQSHNGETLPINSEAHDFSGTPVITPASCIEDGEEVINCGNGCAEKHRTLLDAIGHDWEWTENTIPETCLHSSKDTATCNNTPCTETNERNGSNPALGHTTPQSVPATCTSTGLTGTGHCERCNEDLTGDIIPIVSDNHNFGNWTQKTAATCVSPEIQIRVCSYNPSHTEEQNHGEINSTAHDWGTGWRLLTPATCVAKEKQERICLINHTHYETQDVGEINPSAHDWSSTRSLVRTGVEAKTCNHGCSEISDINLTLVIGDTGPAGGIIFYVAASGITVQGYGSSGDNGYFAQYTAFYLEAAPENEAQSRWQSSENTDNTLIDGVTTFANVGQNNTLTIGVGRKDTQTIVNSAAFAVLTDTVAQRCANKSLNGFTDWFLPSLGELNEMYKAKGQTGIPTTGWFWSSSQGNSGSAWIQDFNGGVPSYLGKASLSGYVRAIRAF